ncbi:MAG: TetR/AcrR family transcriptional regulator [Solirubrobacterales bacterium]
MSVRGAAAQVTRERIIDAAIHAFSERWYDEVTIRGVAADAGVALQTVRNHFATKEELFLAAIERIGASIESVRGSVTPGDVDGAISTLVDDYERTGDLNLRLLAVEPRIKVVRPMMARGRAGHQAWVEHVFADALAGLRGRVRERRTAQLLAVTDVFTWKLLRRDKGLDRDQTIAAMRELVLALHDKIQGAST